MTLKELEAKVTEMEKQLAELRRQVNGKGKANKKDWRATFGMFAGDDLMREIFDEALKFREADRNRARAKGKGRRRAKASA